jgi:hypothetical protein
MYSKDKNAQDKETSTEKVQRKNKRRNWGKKIPVEAGNSASVHTSPGAHPASYTMGTGSFPGVKWPGREVNQPPHLVQRLKKE